MYLDLINLDGINVKTSSFSYSIITYDKKNMGGKHSTIGLYRSVIVRDQHVVCYSPPKSLAPEHFIEKYPVITNDIVVQEFVEGTMINAFWDTETSVWEIATRKVIGARASFSSEKLFRDMFFEAVDECGLNMDETLDKNMCYSFVLQHPDNRIVTPHKNPSLCLVAMYSFEDQTNIIHHDIYDERYRVKNVRVPNIYQYNDYNQVQKIFTNASCFLMGVVIYNKTTDERMKYRNKKFETAKNIRGEKEKLKYLFQSLKREGRASQFLELFPQHTERFAEFNEDITKTANGLFRSYLNCYVNKSVDVTTMHVETKKHLYALHQLYKKELRPNNQYVTPEIVNEYISSF